MESFILNNRTYYKTYQQKSILIVVLYFVVNMRQILVDLERNLQTNKAIKNSDIYG